PRGRKEKESPVTTTGPETRVMPAAERLLAEQKMSPEQITPTGPGRRLLKEDVLRELEKSKEDQSTPELRRRAERPASPAEVLREDREEEVVPMSRLRRAVAERLVEAQQTAALLTTFNEADMTEVLALRKEYGERFQQKYEVKLGFMSFFVKACIDALKQFP